MSARPTVWPSSTGGLEEMPAYAEGLRPRRPFARGSVLQLEFVTVVQRMHLLR
jgi:hypothetical protein